MNRDLILDHPNGELWSIFLYRKLGAYEALLAQEGNSFKTVADRFSKHPKAVPSNFVSVRESHEFAKKGIDLLRAAKVEKFGIRILATDAFT